MQEEKKNAQNGEGKKEKTPRRHGYFIQPPAADKREQTTEGAPAQQKQNEGKSEGGNRPPRHNKNNQRQDTRPEKSAENGQKPAQNTQNNQGSNGGAHKKKNHRRRNKPKTQDNAQVQTAQRNAASESKNSKKPPMADKNKRPSGTVKAPMEHSADDYEEYKLNIDDEHAKNESIDETVKDDENTPKTEVVGIRFKSSGKVYYFDPQGRTFKRGTGAIVDTARGQEFGEVAMTNTFVKSSDIVPPLRPVIRAASTADIEHHAANKQKEQEAFKLCIEKIAEHKLDMKLIDAQYTFDNSKLLFYFTSTNRVDFRELVKDLAALFRTRIELRQIGIRDEAKIIGGLGMCGRPLCCTLFLSDFDQVSIKMAKEQNLSLNSSKISGICGRLMCCLKYEHEAYEYEIKRTPPVDSIVRTENGDGVVTEISPLRGTIKVRLLSSPDVPPKTYKRDEVTMLRKKQSSDKK